MFRPRTYQTYSSNYGWRVSPYPAPAVAFSGPGVSALPGYGTGAYPGMVPYAAPFYGPYPMAGWGYW